MLSVILWIHPLSCLLWCPSFLPLWQLHLSLVFQSELRGMQCESQSTVVLAVHGSGGLIRARAAGGVTRDKIHTLCLCHAAQGKLSAMKQLQQARNGYKDRIAGMKDDVKARESLCLCLG